METRALGPLQVSVIALGCNAFGRRMDQAAVDAVVDAALDAGITLFDTADIYATGESERMLGRALGNRRSEVLIATKFQKVMPEPGSGGASPAWTRRAIEYSLDRLGTDYVDLYQLHRPDPEVPIAETLGALQELVDAGKVRAVGHCNLDAAQMEDAAGAAGEGVGFVSTQFEWSLLIRDCEKNLVPAASRFGLGVLPYRPLAAGALTGKYTSGEEWDPDWHFSQNGTSRERFFAGREAAVRRLQSFAESRGRTLGELALAWITSRSEVASVLVGATRPEQVAANAAAVSWHPSAAEIDEVEALSIDGAQAT